MMVGLKKIWLKKDANANQIGTFSFLPHQTKIIYEKIASVAIVKSFETLSTLRVS